MTVYCLFTKTEQYAFNYGALEEFGRRMKLFQCTHKTDCAGDNPQWKKDETGL